MGIIIVEIFIWGGITWVSQFTAPLVCHRQTKFPTIYPNDMPSQMEILIADRPNKKLSVLDNRYENFR